MFGMCTADTRPAEGATSFMEAMAAAEQTIGKENMLEPKAAKAFLEANKAKILFLDVQDPGSESVPGTHSASLGTLPFKADAAMADFKDPKIADRPKEDPILVTCALGGQAKLAAKLLIDYGFKNVKTVEGGCIAWKA
mmetsp:Transcript_9489/g.16904  ORF Transcript_9489/g.16904 Transcript_9489/m.16904 type:complete len:138 (+) Transcript_9489:77-490(+)